MKLVSPCAELSCCYPVVLFAQIITLLLLSSSSNVVQPSAPEYYTCSGFPRVPLADRITFERSELCIHFYPAACCCWTMTLLKYVNLSMDINHLPWFPVTIMWLLPHQPFWWNCLPRYRIYLRMSLAEHCGISQSQLGCFFVEVILPWKQQKNLFFLQIGEMVRICYVRSLPAVDYSCVMRSEPGPFMK